AALSTRLDRLIFNQNQDQSFPSGASPGRFIVAALFSREPILIEFSSENQPDPLVELIASAIKGSAVHDFEPVPGASERALPPRSIFFVRNLNRMPVKMMCEAMQLIAEPGEMPLVTIATYDRDERYLPLTEAVRDRFGISTRLKMASSPGTTGKTTARLASASELVAMQAAVDAVDLPEQLKHYLVSLVRATRPEGSEHSFLCSRNGKLRGIIQEGTSTRSILSLAATARAMAAMNGRDEVSVEDIQAACLPVLEHRIILTDWACQRQISVADALAMIVEHTPVDGIL
ncbi:MAG: hypothetical protein KC777_23575, partial [Cyanobacteria bacterium HKST-UBA02]|nr:hypothetical protein [Cyanobacteria bacterium HKST-UBA02]